MSEKQYHRLLERQLRRFVKPEQMEGLHPFLENISQFYVDAENERRLLERTLDVSSKELEEANRALRDHYEELIKQEELKRSRDEALAEMERQKEANRAKDAFLSSMSHELRTPLNAIIGFAQILLAKPDTSENVRTFIDKILISGKNLLTLVNTILDFSKIEAGKMEVNKELFWFDEMMKEVKILIEPMCEKKQLSLSCAIPEQVQVLADRQLIKQVVLNLLSNAIKFSPQKGSLEVGIEGQADAMVFYVRDHGHGIASDQIEHLFDPFVQIREHQNEAIKGTGLGLSIVKKIVELHNGTMRVESILGEGSTFYVFLPLHGKVS